MNRRARVAQPWKQQTHSYAQLAMFFEFQENIVKLAQHVPAGMQRALGEPRLAEETALTYDVSSSRLLGASQIYTMPEPVVFQDGLLGLRFLWVLQVFLANQRWVDSGIAVSVLEMYVSFVKHTG